MSKLIPLTQGKFAIVDDEDCERVSSIKWFFDSGYAKRHKGMKKLPMQNFVMNYEIGEEIDHINGNKLDNQKTNLRNVSHRQNAINKGLFKNSRTGYKGVCWDIVHKRYHVTLRYNGKKVFLGRYDNLIEAAKAYDEGAKKYFGEFARLNFPEKA